MRTTGRRAGHWGAVVAACLAAACSSYDERLQDAHRDYYDGQPAQAVLKLEEQLEDDDPDRLPLLLELASALAADGRYAEASARLMDVDDELEYLDYSQDTLNDIASFVFQPETGAYKATPAERVMVNTQNMINFLAIGDLGGAKVEARKVQTFLNRTGIAEDDRYGNPFAWGLAGFVLELAGDPAANDCWMEVPDSPLRPVHVELAGEPAPVEEPPGVILVLVQRGKAPLRRQASYLLPWSGRLHRLIVPTLVDRPTGSSEARVAVDGAASTKLPTLFSYGNQVRARFDQEFPRLVAAAAVQTLGRALIAEAARAGVQGDKGEDWSDLVATAFEWLLSTTTPADTRSWTLLPEAFDGVRLEVPAGSHQVTIQLSGASQRTIEQQVQVAPGGFAVVNVVSAIHLGYTPPPPARGGNLAGTDAGNAALAEISTALALGSILFN